MQDITPAASSQSWQSAMSIIFVDGASISIDIAVAAPGCIVVAAATATTMSTSSDLSQVRMISR